MKTLITCLLVAMALNSKAGNDGSANDAENTRLSLYIPGFLLEAGSWFISKEEDPELKTTLSKMRSISVCIREGSAYREFRAEEREQKLNRLQKQHFEPLLTVQDGSENVSVQFRQNRKNKIRQVVILADDGSTSYIFLRVRCAITEKDLTTWLQSEELATVAKW